MVLCNHFKVAFPCRLIGDLHEWSNETATVPVYFLVKVQSRERARKNLRGKKTLSSSALASNSGAISTAELVGSLRTPMRNPHVVDVSCYLS